MYTVGEVMGRLGVVLCNQSIGIPYNEVRVERRRRGDLGRFWRLLEVIDTLLKKNGKYNDVCKILNIRRLDDISKKTKKNTAKRQTMKKKCIFAG